MSNEAKKLAQAKGYSDVELLGRWRGYEVFEPVYSGWFGKHGDVRTAILVEGEGNVRWTTSSEFQDIMRELG
jgi:hypothetical protein